MKKEATPVDAGKKTKKGETTKKGAKKVMEKNRYIRFDWAAKYMLRNKADFAIFEGLISVLVGEKVTIVELLESESNQGKLPLLGEFYRSRSQSKTQMIINTSAVRFTWTAVFMSTVESSRSFSPIKGLSKSSPK